MFIDAHSHIMSESFNPDRERILGNCAAKNIFIIENGLDYDSNSRVLELAKHPNVFAAIGMHPTVKFDERVILQIKENKERIIAIGEIGLDYLRVEDKEEMKGNFRRMLELAEELKKPVIVHSRRARGRVIKMIKELTVPVILHAFFAGRKELGRVRETEAYISIPPAVSYSEQLQHIAKEMPVQRLFCETDCPYLWKNGRSDPTFVMKSYEKLAELRGLSLDEVEKQIEENFKRVFFTSH